MYSKFVSKVKQLGLTKANRYSVIINGPILAESGFQETLSLMCESTEMPGKSLATTDINLYGPIFKKPYNQIYSEIPFVFLLPMDMKIKNFFDDWMDKVINPTTNISSYYNTYISDIQINQLDNADKVIYSVRLKEAYPLTMNSMPLDNTASNTFHKLGMSFTYRSWERLKV